MTRSEFPVLRTFLFTLFLIILVPNNYAQKITVSGTIEDRTSGERLLSANLYDPVTLKGVISNVYGFYSLTLPAGPVNLVCSYVGYKPFELKMALRHDTTIHIRLEPFISLEEVTISATQAKSAVRSSQMSMTTISGKEIKQLPVFLGEVDVLKALQLLPGV